MILSTDAENAFDQIQHGNPFIIKTQQTRNRREPLELHKEYQQKSTVNKILNRGS